MRNRNWAIALTAVVGAATLCGATAIGWQERSRSERSRNDDAARAYLTSIANGDYGRAYALLCTDETGTDRSSFEQAERDDPVRGYDIESSSEWSSFVDGHGRVYRVRVTRATGSGLVEIPTQGSDPVCIQYGDIRDLDPSPVSGSPTPTSR